MKLGNYIDSLKGKTVSILVDVNRNHLFKESYNGIIDEVGEDFIVLDTNNDKFHIKKIIIQKELVLSVWEFNMKNYSRKDKLREITA